ncbi:hypothetical protein IFM89_001062 [Coptis chinensis]|uniref:Uncharacterized protein n=1 Tax=Coptis chinensis TaxID=261450 RepID=A0A835HAT5_9MAGN|nr:hypothetical protein IFM89_001062 [Coptis chinensis]
MKVLFLAMDLAIGLALPVGGEKATGTGSPIADSCYITASCQEYDLVPLGPQDGSSVAKKREPRKKTQNLILKNHLARGGGKPRIEIAIGKDRPVCNWSQQWITELGVIARFRIPPFAHYWKDVTDDQRKSLHKLVLERMVELQNQPTLEGSNPLTEGEIFDEVLGVRPGYKRGLGHGEAPPSRKRVARI